MIVNATIIGKNARKTKKGTDIVTYCVEVEPSRDYEGQNVYRYVDFNPDTTYQVGEGVLAVLDRYEQNITDLSGSVR